MSHQLPSSHSNASPPQPPSITSPHPSIPCQPFPSTPTAIFSPSPSLNLPHPLNRGQFPRVAFREDDFKASRQDGRSMRHGQYMFSVRPKACPTVRESCEYQKSLYATPETISRRLGDNHSGLPGNWRYHLEVVQHPSRARACGFGNKDFRLISPAIFIRLRICTGSGFVNIEQVEPQFFHLHATLHDVASKEDNSEIWVRSTNRQYERIENLVGNKSSICHVLEDLEGKPGLWFVFSSLSVRTEKDYFLRFSLHFLGWRGFLNMGVKPMTELAMVDSNNFTVFPSKLFPGVAEWTQLSKCFAAQGVSIYLRQDSSSKSRRSHVKVQGQHPASNVKNRDRRHHPYHMNTSELEFQDDIHVLSINSIMNAIGGVKDNVGSEQNRN